MSSYSCQVWYKLNQYVWSILHVTVDACNVYLVRYRKTYEVCVQYCIIPSTNDNKRLHVCVRTSVAGYASTTGVTRHRRELTCVYDCQAMHVVGVLNTCSFVLQALSPKLDNAAQMLLYIARRSTVQILLSDVCAEPT